MVAFSAINTFQNLSIIPTLRHSKATLQKLTIAFYRLKIRSLSLQLLDLSHQIHHFPHHISIK